MWYRGPLWDLVEPSFPAPVPLAGTRANFNLVSRPPEPVCLITQVEIQGADLLLGRADVRTERRSGLANSGAGRPTKRPTDQTTDRPTDRRLSNRPTHRPTADQRPTDETATTVRRMLGLGGSRETLSSTRTRLSQTGASYYLMFAGLISCGQGCASGRPGMPSGHGGVARGCQGRQETPSEPRGARGRQGGAGGHAESQKDRQADLQWGRMSPLPPTES